MGKQSGGTRLQRGGEILEVTPIAEAFQVQEAAQEVRQIISDIQATGISKSPPVKIHEIDGVVANKFKDVTGIEIENNDTYTSVKALTHHQGGGKAARNKELTWEEKAEIVEKMPSMDVYAHTGALVYTDYNIKVVVKPNVEIKIGKKKSVVANHISSSRVIDMKEFQNGDYMLIKTAPSKP